MSLDWSSELAEFRAQLEVLKDRIATLERECLSGENLLLGSLRGRGLRIHRQNPTENLLIPTSLSSDSSLQFYEMMKKYSFRLFLRDIIRTGRPFRSEELIGYCSARVAGDYSRFLVATGTVVQEDDQYHLNRPGVSSFGPTLEWFVARMFQMEFASPAIHGVRFAETAVGGDYDVIALWEGRLVYVEVKSSPPKSIEDPEIRAFLARLEDLLPDMAFFFNDTRLRMKDKVIEIFRRELGKDGIDRPAKREPERISDELYYIAPHIYILNSKKDIVTNFSLCLRDHLRREKNP